VIAARLIAAGIWKGSGVMSPEQFDPDPFLESLAQEGMPWYVRDDTLRLGTQRNGRPSREIAAA
jgi:saccharopine dehydrogenase-like NADP-dependent oxidoreductase